ncbi:hypothetical protein BC938DRAFT_478741 [Jimgerdemannia flammicorona]|uniref:Uncharacterized protein n=1 Tax=Jimgerdemannia flammicorona TaxID=994334 RepID=A0A433QYB2_9FUNG|nr:hypothetical protein BC938DRAFT_478741 [Jimgerdemannia flammicorona]
MRVVDLVEGVDADEKRSGQEREWVEKFVQHRERHVRVPKPNVALHEQRTEIGAPGVARPSQHLFDEPPIVLERRVQLCLRAHLDVRVPPVRHHPTRQELVVARV